MYEKSNNINSNSSELKNSAASIENTTKLAAIGIGVAGAISGALTHGLMGGIGGLLVGGAIGFAVYMIGGSVATVLRAVANIDDNVAISSNKVNALDEKIENIDSSISKTIKAELENASVNVTNAPAQNVPQKATANKAETTKPVAKEEPKVEAKPEPKAEPKVAPKPVTKAEAPAPKVEKTVEKTVEKKPVEPKKVEKSQKKSDDNVEADTKTITFTPFATPAQEEEVLSPFSNPQKTKPVKTEEKKEITNSPFAPAKDTSKSASAKKSSLYRCDVCGNMVNQTPCPRCAKKLGATATVTPEAEKAAEPSEEKSNIWAAATKPATASELANKASTLKKKEIPTEAESPVVEAKVEEPKAEVTSKKGSLYRCDVCGNMVNAVPCPRCAMKSKKSDKKDDKAAPAKKEEKKEDVNPIWAAASKPGGSSGEKLVSSSMPMTSLNPTRYTTKTATETPSWAKPAASSVEETSEEPESSNSSSREKPQEQPRMKPIWER